MKRFLVFLFLICLSSLSVEAKPTAAEVKSFFQSYVQASNSYQRDVFSKYYATNPTIIRVVQKKDGTTQSVTVPFSTYLAESKKGEGLAKTVHYKNNYTNITVTPYKNDFKVSAIRIPSPGGRYPAYFIIGENANGQLKIKVESMNTPRQEFLKK